MLYISLVRNTNYIINLRIAIVNHFIIIQTISKKVIHNIFTPTKIGRHSLFIYTQEFFKKSIQAFRLIGNQTITLKGGFSNGSDVPSSASHKLTDTVSRNMENDARTPFLAGEESR